MQFVTILVLDVNIKRYAMVVACFCQKSTNVGRGAIIIDEKMKTCDWLTLVGFVFIAGASIAGAFRIEGIAWRVLLIMSAVVSLILAITRMLKNKSMAKKIKTLEENQLSVEYDANEEKLSFKKGK